MSKETIAIKALEALARLGNGDQYGNSTGNVIARTALFEMAEQKPVTSGKVVRLKDAFYAGFESYETPCVSYGNVDDKWADYAAAHNIK